MRWGLKSNGCMDSMALIVGVCNALCALVVPCRPHVLSGWDCWGTKDRHFQAPAVQREGTAVWATQLVGLLLLRGRKHIQLIL